MPYQQMLPRHMLRGWGFSRLFGQTVSVPVCHRSCFEKGSRVLLGASSSWPSLAGHVAASCFWAVWPKVDD